MPVDRRVGKTVRVFVSSTFRDMHAERDVLNRVVFPELRRRCQARAAEFVGLDFRWGVTEAEIQRDGTLAICLREIAQCRFFVCLLGERFGSVYPPDEVPVDLWEAARREGELRPLLEHWYGRDDTVTPPVYRLRRERGRPLSEGEALALAQGWEARGLAQGWEARGLAGAGDSLTAHEVARGVLEAAVPPDHALCYLRAPGLTADPGFPPAFVPLFVETDAARQQKLAALKARVRSDHRPVVREYDAHYAGLTIDSAFLPSDLSPTDRAALDDGVVTPEELPKVSPALRAALEQHGTVALTGMDALAAQVIDDLWQVIEPQLARPVPLDAHQRERAYHERFVTRHTAVFQGRRQELQDVGAYLARRDDREILVVTGDPGAGKSAFLAACVRDARAQHPEALVIPHFIGAAPDSASLPATLRSLCETLRREAGLGDAVAEDPDKLRMQLRALLQQAGARRPVVLVIDALNQLDPANRSHDLDWLPLWAPPGTRIVVSTLAGDCLAQLAGRVPADHILTLRPLPADDRRALITALLARRRKQLTPDQLDALLDTGTRPDAALPLYSLVALEELCLFGEYGALEARLAALPPTVPELFAQVLARLEHDHTRPTVEAVCAWLAAARAGLLEAEVLDLLGTNGDFPRLRWTRLYRALEPYLKPVDEEAGDGATGRLDFYHGQLRSAAYRRYFQMDSPSAPPTDQCRRAHRSLAEYFRRVADPDRKGDWDGQSARALRELPFHTARSNDPAEVVRLLTSLPYLSARVAAGDAYQLAEDYALVPGSSELLEWRDFIRQHSQRLTDHPKMLVALVQLEGFPSARLQVSLRTWRHPWLRSWAEPTPPSRPTSTELHLEIKAEKRFPHGRLGAVARQACLIFSVERLGSIRIVDFCDMEDLSTRVPIGTGRPVKVACAPDASSLLVIFEPGEAELHRCTLGSGGRPVASELVARFRCTLPETDQPVVEWHGGAYWMQIRPGTLARVDAATAEIHEVPLFSNAPGELGALLFLDGGRTFAAVRQGHSTILGRTDGVSVRRVASELCTACPCGDLAAAFFADGHAAVFDVTEEPVETATVRAGIVRGAAGWDGGRLLWLKELPDFARLHAWRPGESGARLVDGGLKVVSAGLHVIPHVWGDDGEGGTLVLTTHGVVRFRLAEGGSMRAGLLEWLFGGATWRAVRKEDQTRWLWDGRTGREVCLGTDVPGRLYCALDGRGRFYTARVDRPGLVWDLATLQTASLHYPTMLLNMAVGDPEKGCWFSDRKGGIYYVGDDQQLRLAATVEEGTGSILHVCGDYLLWRGTIPHYFPDMGVEQARAFVFFRRRPGSHTPLERIGERVFAVREGLCVAMDYDHTRARLVLLWQPEGKYPVLRTATVEEFLTDRFLDREIQGAGLLGDSRIAISPDGRVLGIVNSGRELVCLGLESGALIAILAGSLPFTHIAPGGDGASFWLVQASDVVYGCTVVEPV